MTSTAAAVGIGARGLPGERGSIAQSVTASSFSRSTRERSLIHELGPEGAYASQDALDEKAVEVIRWVSKECKECLCVHVNHVVISCSVMFGLRSCACAAATGWGCGEPIVPIVRELCLPQTVSVAGMLDFVLAGCLCGLAWSWSESQNNQT